MTQTNNGKDFQAQLYYLNYQINEISEETQNDQNAKFDKLTENREIIANSIFPRKQSTLLSE